MPGTLAVRLGATRVGELTNIAGDSNLFAFSDAYLEDAARPVLSQSLIDPSGRPRRRIPRTHVVAPAFFSNLLPEPDGLLRAMVASQYRIKSTRDFPFLHALGSDLPGAVEIEALGELRESPERFPDRGELPTTTTPLRFSLAGLQLKFSVSMSRNRFTLPARGEGSHWIVKLPTNAYSRLPENEYHVMRFAAAIGLNVPATRLVDLSEIDGLPQDLPELPLAEPRLAYAIERFDRGPNGARTHYEDLNQIIVMCALLPHRAAEAGSSPAIAHSCAPTARVGESPAPRSRRHGS
jgi:serine/threonine-protein kinase HipA